MTDTTTSSPATQGTIVESVESLLNQFRSKFQYHSDKANSVKADIDRVKEESKFHKSEAAAAKKSIAALARLTGKTTPRKKSDKPRKAREASPELVSLVTSFRAWISSQPNEFSSTAVNEFFKDTTSFLKGKAISAVTSDGTLTVLQQAKGRAAGKYAKGTVTSNTPERELQTV